MFARLGATSASAAAAPSRLLAAQTARAAAARRGLHASAAAANAEGPSFQLTEEQAGIRDLARNFTVRARAALLQLLGSGRADTVVNGVDAYRRTRSSRSRRSMTDRWRCVLASLPCLWNIVLLKPCMLIRSSDTCSTPGR